MSLFRSVVDELDTALKTGAPGKRTEVLRQVTTLFLGAGASLSEQQISLFEDVMNHLISHIEHEALVELSARLAPVAHVPRSVIRRLASDDAIEIAGPVLEQSEELTDDDLVEIVKSKGQAHHLKIAARPHLNEAVTEVLIDRFDAEVASKVAANKGARFSNRGFSKLVMLAEGDDRLTATIASRTDIPPSLFRELLARATDTVRESLLASAPPEAREGVKRVIADISSALGSRITSRHYAEAQQLVSTFSQDTYMTRKKLLEFARAGKIEETIVTLAALNAVTIELVDRLMYAPNPYGVLVLCKVTALNWTIVRAVVMMRPVPEDAPPYNVNELYEDYDRLSPSLAQRLLRFWESRQSAVSSMAGRASAPRPAATEAETVLLPV